MKKYLPYPEKVSILVLMDLCIKTEYLEMPLPPKNVSILVLMDLCIKTDTEFYYIRTENMFQSLF